MDYPDRTRRAVSSASGSPRGESRARRLLDRLRRRKARRHGAVRGHLAVVGAVNAFLAFLNLVTGGDHPWFLYVLGAMSLPLAVHALITRRRDRLQERLEREMALPGEPGEERLDLSERVFRPLRKFYRTGTAFLTGATAAASVSAYLFLINALAGGRFWAIIPAASLALPVVVWGFFAQGRRRRLHGQLEAARSSTEIDAGTLRELPDGDSPAVTEARAIRERIRSLIDANTPGHAELMTNVDEILGEIKRLAVLEHSVDEARALYTLPDLERERTELTSRREDLDSGEGTNASVLREYDTSLAQVEKHIASLRDLEQRHELLRIRLRNGVSSLRQVSLDLVRLRGEQALGELDAGITAKADELSRYLDDLRNSYEQLSEELP